jgi:hypothetical protein
VSWLLLAGARTGDTTVMTVAELCCTVVLAMTVAEYIAGDGTRQYCSHDAS